MGMDFVLDRGSGRYLAVDVKSCPCYPVDDNSGGNWWCVLLWRLIVCRIVSE